MKKFDWKNSIEYELLKNAIDAYNASHEWNSDKKVFCVIDDEPDYFRITLSHIPSGSPNLSTAHAKMMSQREGGGNAIQIKSVFHDIIHQLLRHGLKDLMK